MKSLSRRHFFKAAAATAVVTTIPRQAPAPATLLEAGAALCVILTVTASAAIFVVRLCRPRYILYYKVDEHKLTNAGRDYVCLSCSRAEAERQELTKCQGPKFDLSACQAIADQANTNYLDVACGPVATEPPLRASITLESTTNPTEKNWHTAAPSQVMDLNDDGAQVTFTLPRFDGRLFFRANAYSIA